MNLSSIFSPEAVLARVAAASKKQALKILSERAAAITGLEADEIFSALMEREHAGNTGVGDGSAIPQGKFEALEKTHMLFCTLARPVEYGAFDGLPVDIMFVLLSSISGGTERIKAMAVASRLLRNKRFCRALRDASDAAEMKALLLAAGGAHD